MDDAVTRDEPVHRHLPPSRRRLDHAGPGRGGCPADRVVERPDRVRAAGELVEQQLGPRVVEMNRDGGKGHVHLLGHQHRDNGREALPDLRPRQPEVDRALLVHGQHQQMSRGQTGKDQHIPEVDRFGERRRRRRGGSGSSGCRGGEAGGHGQSGGGDQVSEERTSAQSGLRGRLVGTARGLRHRVISLVRAWQPVCCEHADTGNAGTVKGWSRSCDRTQCSGPR